MNYVSSDKRWLKSKDIKTEHNWNLEIKFFSLLQLLYPIEK